MADLTSEDVLKLARLARLRLTDDELNGYIRDINNILHYVEQLQTVDLDGLEPTYQVTGLKNVMRPDEIIDYEAKPERLMNNVPATEAGHIKVRKTL